MRWWFVAVGGAIAVGWTAAKEPNAKGHCTAILVGAKASAHGTPMTTHSNDCPFCDFRLVKIPPQTHPAGSERNVYLFASQYPRHVGPSRGPSYDPSSVDRRFFNWTDTPSIAQIPQVPATYGYLEGVYPIMNDHHVALGESTCAAKFVSKPVSGGGLARLDIVELGRVALERSATARAAVMLMGELAETFGYYGSFWDTAAAFENSGEALTVTDPNEAWMVHILPDDTGASAIWVAQRIPDDHITAVANRFVIRRVDFSDTDNFMWSANMLGIAKHHGFWDGTTAFDFTSAYAGPPDITLSSTLRVGRVLSLANRHVDFNAFSDPTGTSVPFSVAVDNVLTAQDIMRVQRDHYEGTNADLTKGPAAGPYGDPNRYEVADDDVLDGHFERAIGNYEASYTFVSVLDATHGHNDHIWFGPYSPDSTMYTPVYVLSEHVPMPLRHGSLREFDMSSAYWINALVGNYASKWYAFAHPVVAAAQIHTETNAIARQQVVHAQANAIAASGNSRLLVALLTNASAAFAKTSHADSTALFTTLMTRFHDGVIVSNLTDEYLVATSMSMPRWWLQLVGFYPSTSPPPDSVGRVWTFSPHSTPLPVLIAACTGLVGYFVGRQTRHANYLEIH
ncbi:hypothetical protein H310_07358 [Aphanomyces invadans]|uniref:Peptidase n=1 Tax=Aphanomyces invadans TaxID=157072 RepID=A0A024U4M3_9STRA|nr:hypothetical protein H310_07358 [Aphanomyces invadans]ETW00832.1 hypothetical protein H310_07358 [Aphanomyces invadans]|eukprot:XP_008870967.1 hypothetical protein H310_07358 [Aphanomyces invadans]